MDKDSRPKRHFWRRGGAFVVDFLLAYAVAVVILMAVDAATGGHFYYWGGIGTRTACNEAPPSPLLAQVDALSPLAPGWTRIAFFCEQGAIGGKTRHIIGVNDWIQGDNLTRTSSFTIPVSDTGDQFDARLKLDPTALVAYAVMLGWAWAVGRSPGKRLLGLVVRPVASADEARTVRFRREVLRLGPLALFALVEVILVLAGWWFVDTLPAHLRMMQFVIDKIFILITLYTILALPFAAYYVLPLLRWRGQMFYDRLTGTMVERNGRPAKVP